MVAFVVNALIGWKLEKANEEMMKRKDKRMNHTTEALNNIKTLKFYSWTDAFEKEVQKRRVHEIRAYWTLAIWLGLVIASLYFFPNILSSVVFSTYIGTGHNIDLATVFSVIVFFDLIKEPLRSLPLFLSSVIQFQVAMRRVQKFIDTKEVDPDKMIKHVKHKAIEHIYAVEVTNHSFSWGIKSEEKK